MQSVCRKIADPFNGCGFCLFHHGVSAPETENFESKIHIALAGIWLYHVPSGNVPAASTILCTIGRNH